MTTTATAVRGIDLHAYLVKDPDRAIAFWRDVMRLPVESLYEGAGAEFALPDGSTFGVWRGEGMPWVQGNGIMFAVDDVVAAAAEYRARGAKIAPEIEETPVCKMAFGEDTEGNTFILHQRLRPSS